MNTPRKHTVKVLSDTYTLISDQSEKSLDASAELLNQTIHEILTKAPDIDQKKAIVLAGLKIAHQSVINQEKLDLIDHNEQALVEYIDHEINYSER